MARGLVEGRPDMIFAVGLPPARAARAATERIPIIAMLSGSADLLAAAAVDAGLPTICHWHEMAEAGCLASYGPTRAEVFRTAGFQIARVLQGAQVAELPVEQPTKFELVINLKTAKALGLTIPPSLIGLADEVIE